jgi:hypothetical protein
MALDKEFFKRLHYILCEIDDLNRGLRSEIEPGELSDALDAAIRKIEAEHPELIPNP